MGQALKIPSNSILRRFKFYFDVLKKTSDAYLFATDLQHPVVMISPNLAADFALPGEVLADFDQVWIPCIHPEDRKEYQAFMRSLFVDKSTREHDLEYRVKTHKGEYCWIRCRGRVSNDAAGRPSLFAGTIVRLGQKNKVDEVTGLFNKYQFEQAVRAGLNRYHTDGAGGALMVFGLDNFKIVNETYNRSYGDLVLKTWARHIENILPPMLTLYKLDGDEFGLVYPGCTEADVTAIFSSVQKCMMRPQEIDGHMVFCTISAGTVFYPQAGKDYLVLHKHAEAALDMAKRNGKNKNCLFSKAQYNRWVRSISMRDDLRDSVEQGCRGFSLFFQPQVSARGQKIIGAEALLRWMNPKGRMVAPMEFIPILEETKMIIPVGKWVFEESVKICREWQKKMPEFCVSVNVSYEQIKDGTFQDFVGQCTAKYGIEPRSIVLELTESSIVADWEYVNRQFDAFREQGFRIAMDDFGTGYSSLVYLKNLSCDIVKIDREFVKNILSNDFDRHIVEYTVELCHSVGMKTCIEGVEEVEEYDLLTEICKADSIQGYLFGHPESVPVFEKQFLEPNVEQG